MIYGHYSLVPWNKVRWPNFTPVELACRHCGELYYDEESFDKLQNARTLAGFGFVINSAHRCNLHNARIGGAPNSEHKRIAFDISIKRREKKKILQSCQQAGFETFGFYGTFLHTDTRPRRIWATKQGRITWNGLVQ